MSGTERFELREFLPYLLNQAAESTGREFEIIYKNRYGMRRTEWRVLFHLGRYGSMSAKSIGEMAGVHKTKISRAVRAMEDRRWLVKKRDDQDRRVELLELTPLGKHAYDDLSLSALQYQQALDIKLSAHELAVLRTCLLLLAELPTA